MNEDWLDTVTLWDSAGENKVATVLIPQFRIGPEIVIFGQRFFTLGEVRIGHDADGPVFENRCCEAFAYMVPTQFGSGPV